MIANKSIGLFLRSSSTSIPGAMGTNGNEADIDL